MLTLSEKIKQNPINIKDALKYINDKGNYILLTHEQFIKLCSEINDKKKSYLVKSNGCDFIVEGLEGCTYILDGDLSGSIIVVGSNNCNAVRTGVGLGDAIRVGDGGGDSIRNDEVLKKTSSQAFDEMLLKDILNINRFFIGNSIRDGSGIGNAIFLSNFAGNAIRIGNGEGTSISPNDGCGVILNSEKSSTGKKTFITKYSKDILNIPEKLLTDKDDLIANVLSYQQFISKARYIQQKDSLDRSGFNHSFYLEDINENIIIDLYDNNLNGNYPVNIFLYCNSDCSVEIRLNDIKQYITVTRKDDFNGHIILNGKGNGNVIRLGNGNGHSILLGDINGTARRVGKGIGESYKEGNGLGGVSNIKG